MELSNQLGTVSLVESSADSPLPDTLGMPCGADRSGSFQYLRRVHTTDAGPFCYSEVFLDSGLFRKHRARIQKSTVRRCWTNSTARASAKPARCST